MTATTPAVHHSAQHASNVRLSTVGILRSEWIKLRSLRSTVWAYAVILVLQIAIGLLVISVTVGRDGLPSGTSLTDIPGLGILGVTAGVLFAQLVVSVLGVLVISGEYSTGQIRSSFAAVPKRLPVLWAKAVVFFVVTYVVSFIGILISYLVTAPILAGAGVSSNLFSSEVIVPLLGAALYLALIGVLAMGIGAILRSTAGGIAAALGLLLVVPVIFQLIPADWSASIVDWLPGSVGRAIYDASAVFDWWQALLIMLGWIVIAFGTAAVLMRRRDA
ncbi:ABC transporter permease [Subtercola sp. YIM 133946]|uniref:ABC transporter permease n=1 Tax=Subtercola sp. YIM 133946 TaxID=3118909 RepID=UPI002F939DB7